MKIKYKTWVFEEEENKNIFKINREALIEISGRGDYLVIDKNESLTKSINGPLDGHAFVLPLKWDWVIVKSSLGELFLIPLKKKEYCE